MFESPQLLQARHVNEPMPKFGGGNDLEDGGLGDRRLKFRWTLGEEVAWLGGSWNSLTVFSHGGLEFTLFYLFVKTISVAQITWRRRTGWSVNWNEYGRKWPWPNLRYERERQRQRERETTNILRNSGLLLEIWTRYLQNMKQDTAHSTTAFGHWLLY